MLNHVRTLGANAMEHIHNPPPFCTKVDDVFESNTLAYSGNYWDMPCLIKQMKRAIRHCDRARLTAPLSQRIADSVPEFFLSSFHAGPPVVCGLGSHPQPYHRMSPAPLSHVQDRCPRGVRPFPGYPLYPSRHS
ncbi:hypothetical protein PSEUDO8Z_10531 [Pseudomonas sp. 8Z]|nr:hypothetical protein PSEUDO8Z_10531 [Pseudomonas sp. 8Z]